MLVFGYWLKLNGLLAGEEVNRCYEESCCQGVIYHEIK